MQHLTRPFAMYQPLPADQSSAPAAPKQPAVQHLLAPVTGQSYPLSESPYAVDQLYLFGAGGWLHPRTQKILAPARCKLIQLSPCRSQWAFALSKSLRLHMQIKTQGDLPVAHAQVARGSLLAPGQHLATLNAHTLKQRPMLLLTLHQTNANAPQVVDWHTGQHNAGDDTIATIYALTAAAAAEQTHFSHPYFAG